MQIRRIFTQAGKTGHPSDCSKPDSWQGPYDGVPFRRIAITLPDNSEIPVSAPSSWPVSAVEAFAAHALLRGKVPEKRRRVREGGCPRELRRSVPLKPGEACGHETDIRSALDRVTGGLARSGWDLGYFDHEADALAFQDELRVCLVQRRATFDAAGWQTLGRSWAYGIEDAGPSNAGDRQTHGGCAPLEPMRATQRLDDASALALGRAMLDEIRSEIEAAVRLGGADAAANPMLRSVLETAARQGLPATSARRLMDMCAIGSRPDQVADTHLDFDSDIWALLGAAETSPAALDGMLSSDIEALAVASYGGTGPQTLLEHHRRAAGLGTRVAGPGATINTAAFLTRAGKSALDVDAIVHTVRLLTIALDIAHGEKPADAARPLALNIANLAPVVMSHGLPYGLDEGRGLAATYAALVTAAALATSADLAAHHAPAPAYAAQRNDAERFMRNMQRALLGQSAGYEGLAHTPQPLYPYTAEQARLLDAARAILARAMARCAQSGLRNLALTGVANDAVAAEMLACEAAGIGPMKTLVHYRRLTPDFDDTAIYKVISPAVPRALRALQHDDTQIDRLIDYVVGHGSLADAPGVNHELLRERGFTEEDIETTEGLLATASGIRGVFTPYVLGWDDVFEEDDDVLSRLGFSEWDVEHANFHCCGALTLEGARGLPLEHLPVFDCDEPLGRIGTRHVSLHDRMKMAQAVQPFVTDAVKLDLNLPQTTSLDEIAALYRQADAAGLRSFRFNRAGTDMREPLTYEELLGSDTLSARIQVRSVEADDADTSEFSGADADHISSFDLATAISIGLEHGVPLAVYADAFSGNTDAPSRTFSDALRTIATGYLDGATPAGATYDLPEGRDHGSEHTAPALARRSHNANTSQTNSRTGMRRASSASHASPASGATALSPPSVSGRHREE